MTPTASNENELDPKPSGLIGVIVLALGVLTVWLWSASTWQARIPFFAVAVVLAIVSVCALNEAKKRRPLGESSGNETSPPRETRGTITAIKVVGTNLSSTFNTVADSIK